MTKLIDPENIQQWVPGKVTFDSQANAWSGMSLRGYHYPELDVDIPKMRDYMFVIYRGAGMSNMGRRREGPWEEHQVGQGIVSVLTRAEESQWRWDKPIDVSHLYLSHASIETVASEVFEKDISNIELCDRVRSEDTVLPALVSQLENELVAGELGGQLYVDSLKNQACVHILRRYSNIVFNDVSQGCFNRAQKHLLVDYIEQYLETNIEINDLATLVQMSVFHFGRKFTKDFGSPPHAYIIKKRVERAVRLLSTSNMPIKVIFTQCGFSDQSHMTRIFKRLMGITPAALRKNQS